MLLLDSSPYFSWQTFIKKNDTLVLLPLIASELELNLAYDWLVNLMRQHALDKYWCIPADWSDYRAQLQQSLLDKSYQFTPPHKIKESQQHFLLWSLRDTLVLRSLAQVFSHHLRHKPKLWEHNHHVLAKQKMFKQLFDSIHQYVEVYPDAYAYVAHLKLNPENRQQNQQLCHLLDKHISLEPELQNLLFSYLAQSHQFSHQDTLFDPLAPLLSQILLSSLDERMRNSRYFYARHFGEWLLIAQDKVQLEHAMQSCQKNLKKMGLKLYISTRVVNRVDWGLCFLEFNFDHQIFELANEAHLKRDNHLLLCHQERVEESDIKHYLNCWQRWVQVGLSDCPGFDDKQILRNESVTRVPYPLQKFLIGLAWVQKPLLMLLTLGLGIFLGDFLVEMLDDTLDLANEFERFMNPSYW